MGTSIRKLLCYAAVVWAAFGGRASAQIPAVQSLIINPPIAITIASDGAGTHAAYTLNPTGSYIVFTCNDTDGCDITMGETGAVDGAIVYIRVVSGSNPIYFANTSGVSTIDGPMVMYGATASGEGDILGLMYAGDRWVQIARQLKSALRWHNETRDAVATIYDNGTTASSLLDIVADDSNPFAFRMWNKTFTSTQRHGLFGYQENTGAVHVAHEGSRYVDFYAQKGTTGGFAEIFMVAPALNNQTDGDAGNWMTATGPTNRSDSVFTAPLDAPGASTITNIGVTGAQTVTYRLVCKTYLGYRTSAGTASTTTTANATINSSNHPQIALPATYDGCAGFDIYRTVGHTTQGKIASDVGVSAFPFNDTGIAGDGATVTAITNQTGHFYATQATVDVAIASYTFANLVWTTGFGGAALPKEGQLVWITDSNTNTWGATIAGGGANRVLAVYNGTNWTVVGK